MPPSGCFDGYQPQGVFRDELHRSGLEDMLLRVWRVQVHRTLHALYFSLKPFEFAQPLDNEVAVTSSTIFRRSAAD